MFRREPKKEKAAEERLSCPRCGCEHLPVAYTRHRNKMIVRKRRCRHCGRFIITRERS